MSVADEFSIVSIPPNTSPEVPPPVDLDQIIRELDETDGKLPESALLAAREHRDAIVPKLIEAIERATRLAREGHVVEGNAHFFALFLLTEFQAKEALPAILDAVTLPGELPFNLFEDAITESLSIVLAALAFDSIERLESLIANKDLNEFVRLAVVDAYLLIVRDGRMTRDEAVAKLHAHLRQAMADGDKTLVRIAIWSLISYSPAEAFESINEAIERGLIQDEFGLRFDLNESISTANVWLQREFSRCRPTGFRDTIEELRRWDWDDDVDNDEFTADLDDDEVFADDVIGEWDDDLDYERFDSKPTITICNDTTKVGRNDPCPCGSGKKYKKCCGIR